MNKEDLKKVLESEVFSIGRENYPESQFILTLIKECILHSVDLPGIDLIDLIHFSVSQAIAFTVKTAEEGEIPGELKDSTGIGTLVH